MINISLIFLPSCYQSSFLLRPWFSAMSREETLQNDGTNAWPIHIWLQQLCKMLLLLKSIKTICVLSEFFGGNRLISHWPMLRKHNFNVSLDCSRELSCHGWKLSSSKQQLTFNEFSFQKLPKESGKSIPKNRCLLKKGLFTLQSSLFVQINP